MVASLLAIAQPAYAGPIVYTETGTLSGTIGSTVFTDAAVTLTTVGDTANIVLGTVGGFPVYLLAGTTTIAIGGVGTATFLGPHSWGAFSENVGIGAVGMTDITTRDGLFGNLTPVPPFYDLSTSVTLTGPVATGSSNPRPTTLGDLVLTSATGNATFTAVTGVPEPGTLVSCGASCLLAAATALARRRRIG